MATELKGDSTYFLPINQGTNGAGFDGEKGTQLAKMGIRGAPLEDRSAKDSLIDIINKFLHLEKKTTLSSISTATRRR